MSDSQLSAGATDPNWKPESGHVGNLSTVQQAALDKFKEDIKAEGAFVDERMDDPMLLRCVSFILFYRCHPFCVLARTCLRTTRLSPHEFAYVIGADILQCGKRDACPKCDTLAVERWPRACLPHLPLCARRGRWRRIMAKVTIDGGAL
jgi:hypothetical protein